MTSDSPSSGAPQNPMPPAYDPRRVEKDRYRWWEEQGFFAPEASGLPTPGWVPFAMVLPPPNVTGRLHLGHALTATIQDTLARWRRMVGDKVLWLPGTDHAGIATQFVVEQALAADGLDRRAMGRERFLARVWDWVADTGATIQDQHRRLGASLDWTRERFTLDEGPSRAVAATFQDLHRKGLIYRGERIINWCPRCHTVLSDLETEYEDAQGSLWHIRYPYADGSGRSVTVATTRPETLLGDTAVAVHPDDDRYRDLVGGSVVLPVLGRRIPVVADEHVDRDFGTGALKVTPAHDANDFEIGKRHGLAIIDVMDPDGAMNAEAGPYRGVDRFQARDRIVAQLQDEGLLERVEPYANRVGHCYRCAVVVEPRVSIQWFVDTPPLARPAAQAVRDGRIRIVPERFEATYLNWMDNIRDWCISRQLWWGHPIPAWYCADCDGDRLTVVLAEPLAAPGSGDPVAEAPYRELRAVHGLSHDAVLGRADRVDAAQDAAPIVAAQDPAACPRCGSSDLVQDSDVLDTWFSSALWPHSTLGWPDDTSDLARFYPTAVLETGYDILFFWVARMVMLGLENTGRVPFSVVYLHGLIRDAQRQKMSKTRGNVIDPLDTIDEFGTDALRMAMTIATTPGNDTALTPGRLEAGRNFANKLWNGARFVVGSIQHPDEAPSWPDVPVHREDRWIMSRLQRATETVDRMLHDFQLGQAEQVLRDFLWDEFFDWYIELAKVRLRAGDRTPVPYLAAVLEQSVRLLHPFMPFVTEEIWQHLTDRAPEYDEKPGSLMMASYPDGRPALVDADAEREMADLIDLVHAVRNARAELRIEPSRAVDAIVDAGASTQAIRQETNAVRALARVGSLSLLGKDDPRPDPREVKTAVLGGITVMLPLAGLVDTAAERGRLSAELDDARKRAADLGQRLANDGFRSRAPAAVVEKEEARLAETQERMSRLEDELARLSPLP